MELNEWSGAFRLMVDSESISKLLKDQAETLSSKGQITLAAKLLRNAGNHAIAAQKLLEVI